MNSKKILGYLYGLESPVFKLGLDRIQRLLDRIGNPEKQLKCIHVAGTNGKGSVCAMIFYALREAGYSVGLYTSPHLKKFNERIRVNENLISDEEIVKYFLKIKPLITNQSFFEITTAIAFLYFKEKNVDFAILETGLGGRLDATNVILPLISVITNVGLEHTELLGNTIEKIAFEKAGIIKNNVPVAAGATGNALKVIKNIARERDAHLFFPRKHNHIEFKFLFGEYQQQNKDLAMATLDVLREFHHIKINTRQIVNGIEKTKWPGRLQFVGKNTLIDCAHNPHGFLALREELLLFKKKKKFKNFIFVLGLQKGKDIQEIFRIIKPLASKIIFTKSKHEKALNPKYLLNIFNSIYKDNPIKKISIKNPKKALEYARTISRKEDLVVACGSIYVVGEII